MSSSAALHLVPLRAPRHADRKCMLLLTLAQPGTAWHSLAQLALAWHILGETNGDGGGLLTRGLLTREGCWPGPLPILD